MKWFLDSSNNFLDYSPTRVFSGMKGPQENESGEADAVGRRELGMS